MLFFNLFAGLRRQLKKYLNTSNVILQCICRKRVKVVLCNLNTSNVILQSKATDYINSKKHYLNTSNVILQ